jgi:rare lipoprotein A
VRVEGIDPTEWWAQQGRPVPMMMAQPKMAKVQGAQVEQLKLASAPVEQYSPPPQQHAAATVPVQIDSKKNGSAAASGLYLQVGAFANPDAAELLKDKLSQTVSAPVFINSVARNQQILHRVRLGPISSQGEADRVRDSIRVANLGQATLVKAE